jgi:predicted PurR-regulated permease PerM
MFRLGFILHLFIGSTLAGSAVIAALVMGFDTLYPIMIAAALGFVVAVPVTWLVTKKLYETR